MHRSLLLSVRTHCIILSSQYLLSHLCLQPKAFCLKNDNPLPLVCVYVCAKVVHILWHRDSWEGGGVTWFWPWVVRVLCCVSLFEVQKNWCNWATNTKIHFNFLYDETHAFPHGVMKLIPSSVSLPHSGCEVRPIRTKDFSVGGT